MYKQLTQLLTAARLISRPQGATIKELEERSGISRRSVYRLLDALEELGYPIYDDYDGRERTVRLNEERDRLRWWVPLPKVKLDLEDRVLLDYLFKEATNLPSVAERVGQLRRKIATLVADCGYSLAETNRPAGMGIKPVLLRAAPVGKAQSPHTDEALGKLLRGIDERAVCIVTYEAFSTGLCKTFRINPLALFEYDGGLYVFVLVPYYGDIRILCVERIKALELTEENFVSPADFDAGKRLSDPFGIVLDEPFRARIWFAGDQAPYVREREWPANAGIEDGADGSIYLSIDTSGAYQLKRWVMSFGPSAELLEPEYLRTEIATELSQATRRYGFEK